VKIETGRVDGDGSGQSEGLEGVVDDLLSEARIDGVQARQVQQPEADSLLH
jgi:hypothetical protein